MNNNTVNTKRRRAWHAVVSAIRRTYPFKTKGRLAAFNKLVEDFNHHLPASDRTDAKFFLFLEHFFAQFGDSHTKLNKYPTKKFYLPLGYRVIRLGASTHLLKGNSLLGRIISVDGHKPQALVHYHYARIAGATRRFRLHQALKFTLADSQGQPVRILVSTLAGEKSFTVTRQRATRNQNNIQPILLRRYGKIVYIQIHSWLKEKLSPKQVDSTIKRIARFNPKALVVDVRGNGGGHSPTASYFAGHFFSSTVPVGISERRTSSRSLHTRLSRYYFTPREPFLNIPIVLLIDAGCLSTNEIFVAGMRDNERALLVGQPTGGGSGSPRIFSQPYGRGKFTYQISTWRFYRRTGQLLEGKGISPHIMVKPTLKEIKRGKDAVLERALKEARKMVKA